MRVTLAVGQLPEPRRVLAWIYLGRLAVAIAIFVAAAWVWRDAERDTTLAATLILVISATVTAFSVWYTHLTDRTPGRNYLYGQVVFDTLLVTSIVHLTGSKESAFAPLYVLVICAAAILLPILGGILIGALASILYFADIIWSAHALDASVLLQIGLLSTVALVTGYLGDRLRQTGATLGEVETELRLLRLDTDDVLGSIATGVLTVDGEGRLAYQNAAAGELLGLSAEEWLGKPILETLEARAPGLGGLLERTIASRSGVRRFETAETDDGVILGVSTTVMERGDPRLPTVTAIFQDITERKRMDLLHRRAERLEAVAELSASLAHEIRNPLASIRSAVEQLTGDRVDAEDRTVLRGLVVRESERLSSLLTDFIDYARVTVKERGPVDMEEVVRNVLEVVRAHPQGAGRTLRLTAQEGGTGAWVDGDEDLLHRALLNLTLNGVQWAGAGGTVEVVVDQVESDLLAPATGVADAVRIRVCDSGPGVPAEAMENVFAPFFTLRPGGTGLGLALVQRAAEAHRGAVFVDARNGEWGATFALYLPALPRERNSPKAPRTSTLEPTP